MSVFNYWDPGRDCSNFSFLFFIYLYALPFEASITLISKLRTRQQQQQTKDAKVLNKIPENQIQENAKIITYHDKVGYSLGCELGSKYEKKKGGKKIQIVKEKSDLQIFLFADDITIYLRDLKLYKDIFRLKYLQQRNRI